MSPLTVDYNSWQDTDQSRALVAKLDKDVILFEGKPIFTPMTVQDPPTC